MTQTEWNVGVAGIVVDNDVIGKDKMGSTPQLLIR